MLNFMIFSLPALTIAVISVAKEAVDIQNDVSLIIRSIKVEMEYSKISFLLISGDFLHEDDSLPFTNSLRNTGWNFVVSAGATNHSSTYR